MIRFPTGTPLWVDLASPDVEASVAFYTNLFGWEVGQAKGSSGYRTFSHGGKFVAGVRHLAGEPRSPQWTTYISSTDAVQTARRAETAGGKVLTPTGQNPEMGMMLLQDTVGTVCGVFQEKLFGGARMFNQPVSLTFNLLLTHEPLAGKEFYAEVFGWTPLDRQIGGVSLTYFFNEGRGVAGLMAVNEQGPHAVPAHWQVSFAVEDADRLTSRAVELGGTAEQAVTTPFGRSALIADPHGATFSVIQQTPRVRAAAQTPEGVLL